MDPEYRRPQGAPGNGNPAIFRLMPASPDSLAPKADGNGEVLDAEFWQ